MKETILIVDDDEAILNICRHGLLQRGFNVLTASSGEQALEILEKSPANVLITDINMPGMSGKDLLRSSMSLYPEMPTAIITAYGTLSLAVDTMNMGAQAFLLKPFGIKDLHLTINNLLERNKLFKSDAKLKALNLLSDMDLTITSKNRIEDVAALIVSKSIEVGKGDMAIFLLRDDSEFKVAADEGIKNADEKAIDIDEFISFQMTATHKGTIRHDDDSPMGVMVTKLLGEEVGETIVTPLLHGGNLAVLLVGRYKNSEVFDAADIEAIRVISNHIWSAACPPETKL